MPSSSGFATPLTRQLTILVMIGVSLQLVLNCGCGFFQEKPVITEEEEEPKLDPRQLKELDPGAGYYQTWEMEDGRLVSFVIAIPKDYSPRIAKPLVVALHFGLPRQRQFMGRDMVARLVQPLTSDFKPIIVAPDYVNTSWTNEESEQAVKTRFTTRGLPR